MADPQTAPALGDDDYKQLYAMQMSSDASQRAQASALAKKLTWDEQQQWNTFQKAQPHGSDATRADNSVLGMPPELAVAGVANIGRAALGSGLSMAGRAIAAGKEAVVQAAPTLKYEATKTLLEHMGVPAPLAMTAAIAVSGYKGGKGGAAKATEGAAPAAAAVDVPTVATTAATATGPRTINDAMKIATEQARARAASPVASAPVTPVPPAAQSAAAVGPTSPAGPLSAVPKLKLSGDESKLYMALRKSGNSHSEAVQAIEAQRAMVAKFGLPTSAEVRTSVAERNTTGRWQE